MNKQLPLLVGLVIACMAILFGLQVYSIFSTHQKDSFLLSPNYVEGSAVVYKTQPFTLNFEQQNAILAAINNAKKPDEQAIQTMDKKLPTWSKIVIYMFEKPNVHLIPLGYKDNQLIFSINQKHYIDSQQGTIDRVASKGFDR